MPEAPKWVGFADIRKLEERQKQKKEEAQESNPSLPPGTSLLLDTSQPHNNSLTSITSQPSNASQTPRTSLVEISSQAYQKTSLAPDASLTPNTSLPEQEVKILDSLPEVKGYLRLTYQFIDHLFPQLTPNEVVVYLHLFRLSWGFKKPSCVISLPRLAERCQMSPSGVQLAVRRLITKGLVVKGAPVMGKGKDQGAEFRIVIPDSLVREISLPRETSQVRNTTIKDKAFKANNIKREIHRLSPEEVAEQATIISEVIEGGYTMEQAEAQFKGSFHPDDWQQIQKRIEK